MKKLMMLLLLASVVGAQTVYQPFQEFSNQLKILAAEPSVILQSLGKSAENRDLYAVTVAGDAAADQPAIIIIGGLNAMDLDGSQLCLALLQRLSDESDEMQKLLSRFTFYVLPRVNPDACEAYWQEPVYERLLNAREFDLDHDGMMSEDGYDDLNADGKITMMRVFDPAGEFVADEQDPRLLRQADAVKGEQGMFKVYSEGLDNDKDGQFNEDEKGGVNPDDNFTFAYQSHTFATGPYAVSEKETRAIADFCYQRKNIFAVFSFASDGNLASQWPTVEKWDGRSIIEKLLQNDADYIQEISKEFKQTTGMEQTPEVQANNGDLAEWAYFHFGRWSLNMPIWQVPVSEDSTLQADDPLFHEKSLLQWLDANDPQQFVEWQNVKHPDFPDKQVQVGGFAPFVALTPADSLDAACERFTVFISDFMQKMPVLQLQVKKAELADNVCRVTALLKNTGFLPTNTSLAEHVQWMEKVRIEIELPKGAETISGKSIEIIPRIGGGESVEKSWIITGRLSSELTIKAGSPSCGFVEKHIMR